MTGTASALLLSLLAFANSSTDDDTTNTPKEIGLLERARRDLVQLDVTVEGPPDVVSSLSASDFELSIEGQRVGQFLVDSLCVSNKSEVDNKVAGRPPTHYLLYFDQHNLTIEGRQNSLELAEKVIPALLQGGGRVAIVSAGQTLVTVASWSDDQKALLDALKKLDADKTQWDDYPSLESSRYADLQRAPSMLARCALAGVLQRDELWRTERALHLFSMVLNRFADLDPPKVALYFADTARIRAGEHYYYGDGYRCDRGMFDAQPAFNRVMDQAAAQGVRIYAVQAQGLVGVELFSHVPRAAQDLAVRDAQSGLKALGLETGGDAFLNGVRYGKISDRIRKDQECLYLLSFDPNSYPQDRALTVSVRATRPDVRVHARGRTMIPSESTRRTSRLLAAFGSPESVRQDIALAGTIIPLGFEDGRFKGLVQIAVPALPIDEVSWDLGASLVSRGEVHSEASGRVSVARRGVPVILESEMSFRPGPFELALVAHETATGQLGTVRLQGAWPEGDEGTRVSDIAIVQATTGAFVLDGESRAQGALGVPPTGGVHAEESCVFLSLVCRPGKGPERIVVRRELSGEIHAPFPELELAFTESRCAQVRDVVSGGTLRQGRYTYVVQVGVDREEIRQSRDFNVIAGAPG